MASYLTTGMVQDYLKAYHQKTGKRLTYANAMIWLYQNAQTPISPPAPPDYLSWNGQDYAQLRRIAARTPLRFSEQELLSTSSSNFLVTETPLFAQRDISALLFANYEDAPVHRHEFFEIVYVLEGQCEYENEEKRIVLGAGEICLTAPNTPHAARPVDEGLALHISVRRSTFETVFFGLLKSEHLLSEFFKQCLYQPNKSYILFETVLGNNIRQLLRHILHESNSPEIYANDVCVHYMCILLTEMMRDYGRVELYRNTSSRASTVIPAVLFYLKSNFSDITLSRLADHFNYDMSYLGKQIKRYTGQRFSEIVMRHKLERARFLLENTAEPLEEIATAVGYHSTDHLSRVFQRTYGQTPSHFRRRTHSIARR